MSKREQLQAFLNKTVNAIGDRLYGLNKFQEIEAALSPHKATLDEVEADINFAVKTGDEPALMKALERYLKAYDWAIGEVKK